MSRFADKLVSTQTHRFLYRLRTRWQLTLKHSLSYTSSPSPKSSWTKFKIYEWTCLWNNPNNIENVRLVTEVIVLCVCSFCLVAEIFDTHFPQSPEGGWGFFEVQTGPMTLLLYYSFDACVQGVEILNRTWERRWLPCFPSFCRLPAEDLVVFGSGRIV